MYQFLELTSEDLGHSMFHYAEATTKKAVTKSFMTVTVEPSDEDDRSHLQLSEVEPVGVMAGIYFLDDGTPFSDSFRFNGEAPAIQLLSFETEEANEETRLALFLEPGEQVYRIKRLRKLQDQAFMIENALVPVKLLPFPNLKLPDERSLALSYDVSRSSIKRALNVLAQQGIIFKKRGSGTFVNPLYLKNQSMFHAIGNNLGVSLGLTQLFKQRSNA
ncbi:UTRA domain-containing protein [Weissella confusa]|uniref:UTRA domain-containing protein n=1 Tax=Weissella confusa TaxID=1583 RepID=A0A923NHW6_WEICO|nr:UTRA domain-containing protein [Weissella confusa]